MAATEGEGIVSYKKLLPFRDGGIERLADFFARVEVPGALQQNEFEVLPVNERAQLMLDCIAAARKHVDNVKAIERIIGS